ncbi:unnamed protein product [Urochloa decumbens]|uniref:Uncharacterized protein n=1 Tax=Urochloa decumbens TaxID=240449 RepID=A0ABC9HCH4_9POAL
MVRTTVSFSSDCVAAPTASPSRWQGAPAAMTTLRRGRFLHASAPRLRVGFIGPRIWIFALILVITLMLPDLVLGVNSSSAVLLPDQRLQPATAEVPLPAAPQAQIFHLHPRNAASMVTPTLQLISLSFIYLVVIA